MTAIVTMHVVTATGRMALRFSAPDWFRSNQASWRASVATTYTIGATTTATHASQIEVLRGISWVGL